MKKSVYSLVLMDDVVAAIDELAYKQHTSRSGLINQILAEHVALSTPEQRMRDIFSRLEALMDESFRILPQQGGTMLSMHSALRFKYKPTIRYSVELYREPANGVIGQLKISFRTQNSDLIQALGQFFQTLAETETRYLADYFPGGIRYEIGDGRFYRDIHLPKDPSRRTSEGLGDAIGSYIRMLDSLMKEYFSKLDNPALAVLSLENFYRRMTESSKSEVLI